MGNKRMVIPINFLDENDYLYVKNHPNSSWYIRELVKKDRDNQSKNKTNSDIQIKSSSEKQDKKFNIEKDEVKNIFNTYD